MNLMNLLKSSLDCAEKFLGPTWKLISPKPIKQLLQLIPLIPKEKTIQINWKKNLAQVFLRNELGAHQQGFLTGRECDIKDICAYIDI